MVVYTSRLCDDVAFLPPRENKAHAIACREVLKPDEIDDWKARTNMDAMGRRLLHGEGEATPDGEPSAAPRPTVGGVPVGARQHVGSGPGREIKAGTAVGGDGEVTVVMRSPGKSKNGGKVARLSDEQLRKLQLDPDDVEDWRKDMEEAAEGQAWSLEIVSGAGASKIRGVLEADDDEEDDRGEEERDEKGGGPEGSEEAYREEL
jgi:protein OS-9